MSCWRTTAHSSSIAWTPNCWTPRVLLQAALEKSGPQRLEQIWTNMLDNDYRGLVRVGRTGYGALSEMGWVDGGQYLLALGAKETSQMLEARSAVDPNVIGGNSFYSMYFEREQKWANVSSGGGHVSMREETNPARIAELNDAREVRLERQQKATQFHADDPYRSITRSPVTASVNGMPGEWQSPTRRADIGPGHPEYALLQQVRQGVAAIDAQAGRSHDGNSERLTASVMAMARQNNLERADHIVLSAQTANGPAGRHVFVVHGCAERLRASTHLDAHRSGRTDPCVALTAAAGDSQRASPAGAGAEPDSRHGQSGA